MHKSRCFFLPLVFLFGLSSFAQENEVKTDTLTNVITTSKTHEGQSFSVINQPKPIDLRKLPQEKVEQLKHDDDYWYANAEPEKKEEPKEHTGTQNEPFLNKAWARSFLWILVLCSFIGVVIWYLASSNIGLFRKPAKKIVEEVDEDGIDEDIFGINYEKEIQKAVAAGNYRLAVRLWYLQTLKELADRNLIAYRADRPNSEYLNALYGGTHYRDFFRLTRSFEYTWYGGFPLSEESYRLAQNDFLQFKKSLS